MFKVCKEIHKYNIGTHFKNISELKWCHSITCGTKWAAQHTCWLANQIPYHLWSHMNLQSQVECKKHKRAQNCNAFLTCYVREKSGYLVYFRHKYHRQKLTGFFVSINQRQAVPLVHTNIHEKMRCTISFTRLASQVWSGTSFLMADLPGKFPILYF